MSNFLRRVAAVAGLLAYLAPWLPSDAAGLPRDPLNGRQSYSSSTLSCLVANDFYVVHFTALQPGRSGAETTDFAKYCQALPASGKTFLTLDLLDRDVRTTPIGLTVVEEEIFDDGRLPVVKKTLSEVPARIYGNGIADIQVDIPQKGHYAVIASFGESPFSEDDRLRVPFSVALPPPTDYGQLTGKAVGAVVLAFFGAMGIIGIRTLRRFWPKRSGAEPDTDGARAK